jgi:hypothetical protein
MELSPIATRLLEQAERAQAQLIERTAAPEPVRHALAAVQAALAAALAGIEEETLLRSPAPDAWCMAEVVEHVAEHDGRFGELEQLGLSHYVEHGLEHALQLWKLRDETLTAAGRRDGHASGTLD